MSGPSPQFYAGLPFDQFQEGDVDIFSGMRHRHQAGSLRMPEVEVVTLGPFQLPAGCLELLDDVSAAWHCPRSRLTWNKYTHFLCSVKPSP